MATIVLVHGIAQEDLAADPLEENVWLPALAGGLRNSGYPELADRIRLSEGIEVRMAYYGEVFKDPGAMGVGTIDPDTEPLSPDAEALAEQLARVWLESAVNAASDPSDRLQGKRELVMLDDDGAEAQGLRSAVGRPALNALSRIRWFAPFGMGVGSFVWRALTQVSRYLTDDDIRSYAQQQVLDLIEADTRLVIGHSLGSVVAYEAVHRVVMPAEQELTLVTLGSPLALQNIVYERLRPQPPRTPAAVTRWENFAAEDDLVAARLDLQPYFPPAAGRTVLPISHVVDTGSKPHDVTHYLTKPSVGRVVAEALAGMGQA